MQDQQQAPSLHQRLTRKMMASRFLTTSLLIHVMLISLLGSVVLFQAARDTSSFVSVGSSDGFLSDQPAEQAAEAEVTEFEEPAEAAAVSPSASVAPASAISSLTDSAASWSTAATMDYAAFGNSLNATRTLSSGTGSGTGSGSGLGGGGKGKMSGTLFGVKVEAQKLGVVLDVSGSAHPYLAHALAEIDKSFKGAPTVLYLGCGLVSDSKAKDYEVKRAKSYAKQLENGDPEVPITVIVGGLMRQENESGKSLKRLMRTKDAFITVSDKKTPPTVGCQYALESLIQEGVDTIYWFADFTDKVDAEAAQDLAAKLQAKGIKVIAHNFAGKPVPPGVMTIVSATGGQAITAVPGK